MEEKIVISGFGGQGIVLAGNVLAQTALAEDKNVTAMVSYGAEMRGGTANCTLTIADKDISSPAFDNRCRNKSRRRIDICSTAPQGIRCIGLRS